MSDSTTTLHIISHTHWDREWYLTFQQFRFRLVELVDGLLDLLARDAEFHHFHLDGQTIVLEDYLEIRPQREAELARHIGAGRILVGPWYVQPDEFLVSGEAMIRNLQIGLRIARRYGEPMMIGYLPDSFGHIANMPQIMRGFGLDTFVHARGTFVSKTGGTEYWWSGIDGSRVLGVFLANWYDNARRFPEGDEALPWIERVVERLKAANAGHDLILMNGVDHFVAQENLSSVRRSLEGRLQAGRLVHSTLPQAIAALRAAAGGHLRELHGELRDESELTLLTGVLSARIELKQANAAIERLLETWVEPYETYAALLGKPYDADFLRYAWKTLLLNHPHDSICGCSIDQVHQEMLPRFDQAKQVAEELLQRSLGYLAARVDTRPPEADGAAEASTSLPDWLRTTALIVHNPLPRPRSDVAVFEVDFERRDEWYEVEIVDQAGNTVPCQVLGRQQRTRKQLSPIDTPREIPVSRYMLAAAFDDVPGCGYRVYTARLLRRLPKTDGALARPATLENEHLLVTVGPDGTLSVRDKAAGVELQRLNFMRDEGDIGDQYNFIKPPADEVIETLGGGAEVRLVAAGPVVCELEVTVRPRLPVALRADRQSRSDEAREVPIRSRVRLLRGARRVEIGTELDNTVEDHRIRAVFPLDAPVTSALADTQFGVVDRPVELPSYWPFNSRDRPHRSWVDVRAGSRGLTLLSRGLYEHDIRPDGQLELTLLRAVGHMFVDFHTFAPLDPVRGGQCLRSYRLEYAIAPHDGTRAVEDIAELAAAYQAPLRVVQAEHHDGSLPRRYSFLSIDNPALQLSAVKQAEDRPGVVVRCFNTTGTQARGSLQIAGALSEAFLTDLDEQRSAPLPLGAGGTVEIAAGPFGIVTVELRIEN